MRRGRFFRPATIFAASIAASVGLSRAGGPQDAASAAGTDGFLADCLRLTPAMAESGCVCADENLTQLQEFEPTLTGGVREAYSRARDEHELRVRLSAGVQGRRLQDTVDEIAEACRHVEAAASGVGAAAEPTIGSLDGFTLIPSDYQTGPTDLAGRWEGIVAVPNWDPLTGYDGSSTSYRVMMTFVRDGAGTWSGESEYPWYACKKRIEVFGDDPEGDWPLFVERVAQGRNTCFSGLPFRLIAPGEAHPNAVRAIWIDQRGGDRPAITATLYKFKE